MQHIRACITTVATLALSASLAAAQTPPSVNAAVAPLPTAALPAELDRVLRDYEKAWRTRDANGLSQLFADDGFVLQGGKPPVRGRAAIARAYAGQGGGALTLRALAFATQDTVGYIIGAYAYGDSTGDVGKFTLTLKRARGGRWLIFSDMDNASRAPRTGG